MDFCGPTDPLDLIGDNKTTRFLMALRKPGNHMVVSIIDDLRGQKKKKKQRGGKF